MRKGKSSSVDLGEGAKEEEGVMEGDEAEEVEGVNVESATTATEETNNKEAVVAGEKTDAAEADKTPADAPVTNGENGCSNGTAEVEHTTHNHQEEEKLTAGSPVKKSKEAAGKDDTNAKIINATPAVNSGELQHAELDDDELQHSNNNEDTNNRQQQQTLINVSCKESCQQRELALAVSTEEVGEEGGEAETCDQGERMGREDDEEEQMRKRELRDAAAAIVQNVMSAATNQLERELHVDSGLNGCCHDDISFL